MPEATWIKGVAVLAMLMALSALAQPALPAAKVEVIGTPVRSARTWAWPVTPNPRGGYNFITQVWNSGSKANPEWIVIDLDTGKYTSTDAIPGYNNAAFGMEFGVRAANGRIFFALAGNGVCYYEPTDETIKPMGSLLPVKSGGPTRFHIMRLGPDGQVYGSTQSSDGYAYVVMINPDTLEVKTFDRIGGKKRAVGLTYGYRLAMDPPWVYVAVGQGHWSLVALNTDTGESRILTEIDEGLIAFDTLEAVRGKVRDAKGEYTFYWCVDGKLIPAKNPSSATGEPFLPRPQRKIEFKQTKLWPIADKPPEVDIAGLGTLVDGRFQVRWRPAGSTAEADWKTVSFPVAHVEPIAIESLIGLPDGTVMGNVQQYNGFFRYTPAAQKLEWFGKHGPSRPAEAIYGGKLYFSGYPGGQMFVFDPVRPWKSGPQGGVSATGPEFNPELLGYFKESGAKYAYYLIPAENGRLYFGGRREREGQGSCVGYYEPATKKFAGHHEKLNFLQPRGMAVLPKLGRVVLSGQLIDDPTQRDGKPAEAQLVMYDLELTELERMTVKPGLTNTGALYPAADGAQIIGVIRDPAVNAMYLYNTQKKSLAKWVPTDPPMDRFVRHPRENWYLGWQGGKLVKVDAATLEVTPLASLEKMPDRLAWAGGEVYGTYGSELVRVSWGKE